MVRTLRLLVLCLLAALLAAATALADADPASDVLLGASVFYPYSPPVSADLEKSLNGEVTAAGRAHFPLKVALIDSPTDLGGLPSFFGKPQPYASFLDQELAFIAPHPPLLVVMPDGYGVRGLPTAATAAAASLSKPGGTQSSDLVRAAIVAVPRLAAAAGHPIKQVSGSSSAGGSSALAGVIALVVVAVAASGGVIAFRFRRRPLER
jgi:hypothetical protein